jgi:hypothetical protein
MNGKIIRNGVDMRNKDGRKGQLIEEDFFPGLIWQLFKTDLCWSGICTLPFPQFPIPQFKMSSIKQLIINAIIKVSGANPALDREGEPTAIEARDLFIKDLMAELFPEDPSVPVASPKKAKKTKKTKTEDVVVVKADDDVPPPLEKDDVAVAEIPVVAAEPAVESPGKKKRGPMSDEAKAAMKAKRDATVAAKKAGGVSPAPAPEAVAAVEVAPVPAAAEPVKEKKPRKPKSDKPAEDANLAKVDPTWRKHLKHADKDHAKELEPELLKFLNAMSKSDFDAKKAEEHVADFIASRVTKAVDDGKVEADLIEVDFESKTYYVNPETKRVYEGEGVCDEDGNWTNYKGVGYVGMAAFEKMSVDE